MPSGTRPLFTKMVFPLLRLRPTMPLPLLRIPLLKYPIWWHRPGWRTMRRSHGRFTASISSTLPRRTSWYIPSDKLLQVKKGMKVVVRYFVKAAESTGKYISLTGTVVMIDPVYRELKVMQDSNRKAVGIEKELPVIIPFDDIADLAGEGITRIEDYLGLEKYPDDI